MATHNNATVADLARDLEELFEPDSVRDTLNTEYHDAALRLAQAGVDYAQSIAPVDSGDYKESIHVEADGDEVYMVCDSPIANIIEYGTVDTPEFAVMTRAATYINSGDIEL